MAIERLRSDTVFLPRYAAALADYLQWLGPAFNPSFQTRGAP